MTVQYIRDTIKQAIKPEKKEEPANYPFSSNFLKIMSMYMTPELEEMFNKYSSELNKDFNNF